MGTVPNLRYSNKEMCWVYSCSKRKGLLTGSAVISLVRLKKKNLKAPTVQIQPRSPVQRLLGHVCTVGASSGLLRKSRFSYRLMVAVVFVDLDVEELISVHL